MHRGTDRYVSGSGAIASSPTAFAKGYKANVSAKELKALKRLADVLLGFSKAQLAAARAAVEFSAQRI
jgi:hypothetical protein